MGNSANRKIAQKKAAKKRPQTWKPGQSGNPKGSPKRGDSWAETIKSIGEMDGPSIAALWDTQHREFGKLPEGISMKQLVVMTVYAALLREPSPGNWRELMDRAEGKVREVISGDPDHPIVLKSEQLTDDDLTRIIATIAARSGSGITSAPTGTPEA